MSQLIPIVNQPFLYINNMEVSRASATTLSVAAGQCRDSNNAIDLILSAAVTIDGAVNGYNGLDVGSFALNKWYYVHIIGDSTKTNPTGALISLSKTAPTLPFGYDSFRHIFQWRTNGSTEFIIGNSAGNGNYRQHYWDTNIAVLSNGTATSLTAIDLDGAVPPIENTPVILAVAFTPATANDKVSFAPAGSTATVLQSLSGVVAAKIQTGQLKVLSKIASSTARILYINSAASGDSDVWVSGYDCYI